MSQLKPVPGRLAAELYEVGRLFGRRGMPLPAFFAIQLLWASYGLLVTAIWRLVGHDPVLPLPAFAPFSWFGSGIPLLWLYLVGAVALTAGWAVWAGWSTYVRLLVRAVAHRALLHICVLVPSILGVVAGSAVFVGTFLSRTAGLLVDRWFMGRSRVRRVRTVPRLRAILRLARRHADQATEVRVERWMDAWLPRVRRTMSRFALGGRVSVAPLAAATYDQAAQASRLPQDTFALAATRLRDDLASVSEEAEQLELSLLPAPWNPRTPAAARWLRRCTGSDLLLWGGFAEDDDTGWLRIERKVPNLAAEHGDRLRHLRLHSLDGGELFPDHWSPKLTPSLRVDLRSERDSHTTYLLCALQVFEDRSRRRRRWLPRSADRFHSLFRSHRDALVRLLLETFEALPDEPLPAHDPPLPDHLITRAISDWIGHELSSRKPPVRDTRELSRLTRLIEKCIILQPGEPAHYYRYGTLLCLHGDGEGALAAFQEAGEQLAEDSPRSPSADLVDVELSLKQGTVPFDERDLHLARCAAFTARALHLGGPETAGGVREALSNQPEFADLEEFQLSAGFAVTQHLVRQE